MTTYSKETALYNSGAIANDIESASETASKFLSVDSSGIMVYDGSNGEQAPSTVTAGTKNVFIDDDSMDVRDGTTMLAQFGASGAQIGADNSSRIILDPSTVSMLTANGVPYFSIALEGGGTEPITSKYIMASNKSATNMNLSDRKMIIVHNGVYEPLTLLASGDDFTIEMKLSHLHKNNNYPSSSYSVIGERTISHSFIKGTTETYDASHYSISTNPDYFEYDASIYYDGNNVLNIYIQHFKRTVGNSFPYYYRITLNDATFVASVTTVVPLLEMTGKYHINLFVDPSASSATAATSGSDKDIFNAIRSLGWYNYVIE